MKLNDLTDVTITAPATVVNYYYYDGNGMRYCKTDSSGTTYYSYDGLNPILERDGSGAVQAHYTHGRSDIAGIGSLTVAKRNGSHQYPHMDQIGSVRNLTDDSETVVQYYEYDAFGNELESAGSQSNLIRYSSHILDEDTDLIYNFARQYEPGVGRFLSRDRRREVLSRAGARYVYVRNLPTRLVDRDGRQDESSLGVYGDPGEAGHHWIEVTTPISGTGGTEITVYEFTGNSPNVRTFAPDGRLTPENYDTSYGNRELVQDLRKSDSPYRYLESGQYQNVPCDRATMAQVRDCMDTVAGKPGWQREWNDIYRNCRQFVDDVVSSCCLTHDKAPGVNLIKGIAEGARVVGESQMP